MKPEKYVRKGDPPGVWSAHRLSTCSSRSATLFSIRKMSISSSEKERATVLEDRSFIISTIRNLHVPEIGQHIGGGHRGDSLRLGPTPTGLPVTIEFLVCHSHGVCWRRNRGDGRVRGAGGSQKEG